jgi:hypothetical protein
MATEGTLSRAWDQHLAAEFAARSADGVERSIAAIGTRLPDREDAPIPPTPEHMDRVARLAASYGVEIVPG